MNTYQVEIAVYQVFTVQAETLENAKIKIANGIFDANPLHIQGIKPLMSTVKRYRGD